MQQLQVPGDGRQRRAQVVGDVHHRLLQLLVPLLVPQPLLPQGPAAPGLKRWPASAAPCPGRAGTAVCWCPAPGAPPGPAEGLLFRGAAGPLLFPAQRHQGQTSRQHPNHSHPPICAGAPAAGLPQPAASSSPITAPPQSHSMALFYHLPLEDGKADTRGQGGEQASVHRQMPGRLRAMLAIWKHCPPGVSSYRN